MTSVLVVEDDETIGRLLSSGLRSSGYDVAWERTGESALVEAGRRAVDLVLLDLGLPDVDGLHVCRDLRLQLPAAVIVILTARGDEMDVVTGLEFGADDYLTKPFSLVELLARVRAHLRRSTNLVEPTELPMVVGSLEVDPMARATRVGSSEVTLRAKEFELLLRLTRDAGAAVSRETLMNEVWDENWFGSTKTLDVHVAALRRKMAAAASEAGDDAKRDLPTLTTLRGHGYRLDPPS